MYRGMRTVSEPSFEKFAIIQRTYKEKDKKRNKCVEAQRRSHSTPSHDPYKREIHQKSKEEGREEMMNLWSLRWITVAGYCMYVQ
ncbi:hypothetical protein HYALB_00010718 [Hymenoscyphus albidus]|uniref:Uncharacterized protein n=1 Tax=Hymenoscyphus albidus TaxID=595503 RepID=A0A9N9Q891_9HELO|nr:hypothetical protein HYALB_00010718 [Hymenoscyphus albidus]